MKETPWFFPFLAKFFLLFFYSFPIFYKFFLSGGTLPPCPCAGYATTQSLYDNNVSLIIFIIFCQISLGQFLNKLRQLSDTCHQNEHCHPIYCTQITFSVLTGSDILHCASKTIKCQILAGLEFLWQSENPFLQRLHTMFFTCAYWRQRCILSCTCFYVPCMDWEKMWVEWMDVWSCLVLSSPVLSLYVCFLSCLFSCWCGCVLSEGCEIWGCKIVCMLVFCLFFTK